jgi:hypothetical protein
MTDVPDERPLQPVENEVEQALLGALIISGEAYRRVADILKPEHFGNAVHASIYAAIAELSRNGIEPDPVLVKNLLGEREVLVPLGGTANYLARLITARGVPSNVNHYAKTLIETAERRLALQVCRDMSSAVAEGSLPVAEIVARVDVELRRIVDAASARDSLSVIHFDEMQPMLCGNYLVKGLLGSTGMAVIYGAPGSGKTFFALRLGLCVAAGLPFFGRRTRQAGVVYIAAEAGRSIANRVAAVRNEFPPGTPFIAITSPIDLRSSDADVTRLVTRLRSLDLGVPIGLIIIDTLSRVMAGGNENAPDDMGALVRNCDRLRDETGAFLGIVHHSGKDAAKGARGHNLLLAATDTEIEVSQDEDAKLSTARITKQRDFATDDSFAFKLCQVEIGVDEDGDPVTSCSVDENVTPPTARPLLHKLTGAAAAGMQQLANCLAAHGETMPTSDHIPSNINGVTLGRWKSWLINAGILNPDGNPREQFRRIRVTLQGRKIIGVWGDYVWLSHPSRTVTSASQ